MSRQMEIQDPRVETKLALWNGAQHLLAQRRSKPWDAVCRQPHHDVFVMIRSESQIGRDCRIELAPRMRKDNARKHTDLFPVGASEHRRVGFGRSVDDHDRRPLEWRNQHRACGMAEMMVKK